MKSFNLFICILFLNISVIAQTENELQRFEFNNFSWVIEKVSDQTIVEIKDSVLEVTATNGITLWLDQEIESPAKIEFEAKVIHHNGKFDRVSDLNCFWMANDPQHPNDFFARSTWRHGTFGNYYSLSQYYVGYGGNNNSTTRFRKYDGNFDAFAKEKIRPKVIQEFTDAENLITPNHWYKIQITTIDNLVKYQIDDRLLIEFNDENPYTKGYFGLRTVKNHIQYKNVKVTPLTK